MGTKGLLLTHWGLALGFLGAMGICTNAMAETASYSAPQIDTQSAKNPNSPMSAALAAGPCSPDENEAADELLPPEWTTKDCYDAWKYNMMRCNASPPNLRPACWAAASALLAACLGAAQ